MNVFDSGESSATVRRPFEMSRRQLLQVLGLGGAGAFLGACALGGEASDAAAKKVVAAKGKRTTPTTQKPKPTPADSRAPRTLVVIELQGGHDGFAMLVPYGDGRFRKLRDRIWVEPKDLHVIDDRYALAKGLAPVAKDLAFIEGVGVAKPDLSHFAMLARWWAGDPAGDAGLITGFLGRCCDVLGGQEPVTGVSVGGGSTPALVSQHATTVSLPQLDQVREFAKEEPDEQRLRASLRGLAHDAGGFGDATVDALLAAARAGLDAGIDLSSMVGRISENPKSYPSDNDLASSLASIRQLISVGSGVRIFHVPWGSFDTHSNEVGAHSDQMNRLGAALAAFRDDLAAHGLSDRVLVVTTSEFGRRPEANAGGTDHGTASTMLLMGPAKAGRHGIAPDFASLDDTGNVRATVAMTDYYATLANWLGARPADVLPKPGVVIDTLGLVRAGS